MQGKTVILEAARWIAVVAAVVYLLLLLGGNTVSSAAVEDVSQAVLETVDTANMKPAENQMIKRLYGLDPATFEGCVLYYPATNMMAEEMLIVKLADTSQQEAVLEAMQTRVQTQMNTFEGYGVEQYDLLTNYCVMEVRGNYALLIVNKNCGEAQNAFRDAL